MGKPTGFLEYDRKNNPSLEPAERIRHYQEFHPPLCPEDRRSQAARCMNCGVPFCQSAMKLGGMVTGCPLHNLIPEWNDELYNENNSYGAARLLKTNNFPEFTGRVCPALCEKACICGQYDSPVTIRENELYLIEDAFEKGWMTPHPPRVRTDKKVAVVGSGPSGLAAADQLNRRGHNVTVFERDDRPGGLLMYGIPNMKLDKKIVERRIDLMEKEGIRFMTKTDIGKDIFAEELLSSYDAVILCCGSKEPRDLNVSGREADGVCFAVDFLTSATRSLIQDREVRTAKDKHVIVLGGGDTGNDCVGTCIRQGAKSVTQLEMMPKPPEERTAANPWPQWPKVLKTDYGQEEAIAVYGHDPRIYETTIKSIDMTKNGKMKSVKTVQVQFKNGVLTEKKGSEQILKANLLLIAAGFIGCNDYVTDAFNVGRTERGTVQTTPGSYHTDIEKVFSAGDMHRGQSLVVWAIHEGRSCAKEVDRYLMDYTNMEL